MKYLIVWILWPELRMYLQGVWFSNKSENILTAIVTCFGYFSFIQRNSLQSFW